VDGEVMSDTGFPRIEVYLTDVMDFAATLAQDLDSGKIASQPVMAKRVRDFFTPEKLDDVEGTIPGWRQMSSYADGITLVHVMSAVAALFLCPEYQAATEHQQALLKWIVLLHDVNKKVINGKRDPTHAFRSAAKAGQIIARLGFGVTERYKARANGWVRLTESATVTQGYTSIPDNRRLPEILDGLEEIFGQATPSALAVKAILFHLSVNVVKRWPQTAPLSATQTRKYIGFELLPLLKVMMLVDNDAWNLFDRSLRETFRRETLLVFREMERTLRERGS
jgi:hypothetical protein